MAWKRTRIGLRMAMRPPNPCRGEIWMAGLDPVRGHEQGGTRPCLVISVDPFNRIPSGVVVVVPLTSRQRNIPSHVEVNPPDGGLQIRSFIRCEDIRCISQERLTARRGVVSDATIARVEQRLRLILGL
ncbi:MAG TPA: type II toxin-antitoxin system PemK/MazF family toxin [Armatimonadota bacterium]|nr:type II toxin-antitoxin system PemK/MazF family toxin [Armatimonadota bacterium]